MHSLNVRKTITFVVIMVISVAVMTPFTNCGKYADPMTFSSSSQITECDEDCIQPTTANLSVKAHLKDSSNEFKVTADLIEWNLGGDCNEGGFPHNTIRWELMLNGVKVRDSGMLGIAGNQSAHSRCVNGRFLLYINMAAINEDNVDRTGLATGAGARASYDLYIEIFGQERASGQGHRNSSKGRTRVTLIPI
ncbi:MAG: hypothetical protein AB7G93_15645 [Bdellovibrionales bacterium]